MVDSILADSDGMQRQSGHTDFELVPGLLPRNFMIAIHRVGCSIWVCPRLHHFVFHGEEPKLPLPEHMEIEEVPCPPFSAFIWHDYAQHVDLAWEVSPCSFYHVITILHEVVRRDAIGIAYGEPFEFRSWDKN